MWLHISSCLNNWKLSKKCNMFRLSKSTKILKAKFSITSNLIAPLTLFFGSNNDVPKVAYLPYNHSTGTSACSVDYRYHLDALSIRIVLPCSAATLDRRQTPDRVPPVLEDFGPVRRFHCPAPCTGNARCACKWIQKDRTLFSWVVDNKAPLVPCVHRQENLYSIASKEQLDLAKFYESRKHNLTGDVGDRNEK